MTDREPLCDDPSCSDPEREEPYSIVSGTTTFGHKDVTTDNERSTVTVLLRY